MSSRSQSFERTQARPQKKEHSQKRKQALILARSARWELHQEHADEYREEMEENFDVQYQEDEANSSDPNDIFEEGQGLPFDESWKDSSPTFTHLFLLKTPRIQWFILELAGTLVLKPVKMQKGSLTARRRRFLLEALVRLQERYLSTLDLRDLRVLSAEELIAQVKVDGLDPQDISLLQNGNITPAQCIHDQHLLTPDGTAIAASFLLQSDFCGVPEALVLHEIRVLIETEASKKHADSDQVFAENLSERLLIPITQQEVRRLRNRKDLWFPKRSERVKLYARS